MDKITSRVSTWPFLLCVPPLLVARALHRIDAVDAGWLTYTSILLGIIIGFVGAIIDNLRSANRFVEIRSLGVLLFLWVLEALAFGFLLPHPVDGAAFYTTATVDAAILIAIVVSPGIPTAWHTDDRSKWTWVVGIIGMILLAIGVAVVGGIVADHNPTPTSFNEPLLTLHAGNNAFVLEPCMFLLGAALFPLALGVMALAYWMRFRVISPESP